MLINNKNNIYKINKTIHYIWLGGNQKPNNFEQVFESWKTFAKYFEIKEWTEKDEKEFDLPEYYFEAKKQKIWAFASDVLRCYILQKYGGVYFDIDQVLVKDINILWQKYLIDINLFTATFHEKSDYYGFQFFGCNTQNILISKMCEFYNQQKKIKEFIIINKIFSDILNQEISKNKNYLTENNIKIFTQDYFYPLTKKDYTENTYSYHLANTSWIPTWKKFLYKLPFYNKVKNIIFRHSKFLKNKLSKIKY